MNDKELRSAAVPLLFCTLGMGCYLAWTVGNAFTRVFAGIPLDSVEHDVDIICGLGINIVALAVVVAMSGRIGSLAARRPVRMAMITLSCLAPLLVVAGNRLLLVLPLLAIGSLCRGAVSALLFLMWNELLCRFSARKVGICYGGAYLLSVLLQALMGALPTGAAFVFVLICGIIAAALLKPAFDHVPAEESAPASEETRWSFPWQPLLLAVVYTFIAFMFRQAISDDSASFSWLGGGLVALVCLLGCLFFFDKGFDTRVMERLALPLMIAGILLWCWRSANPAVLYLTDAANVSFRIFLLSALCGICYRFKVPALWLLGLARIAMQAAEGCGLLLTIGIVHSFGGFDLRMMTPYCFAMVLVLVIVYMETARRRELRKEPWRILPKKNSSKPQDQQLREVMSASELAAWKCAQVARLYGLTHREEQVLACLVAGRSRVQIQEELELSENTVRTHMRHLYAKLDVHSRDDAVAIVCGDE